MIATAFDEENSVMHPPALSVFRGPMADGTPCVISCWKPTPEEWEEMKRTGRVWLIVWGGGMPPVALAGQSPFGKSE